eukprot:COSAG01_NODE_5249_length_4385_cov_9.553663_7_plen_126_part_00
MRASSSTGAWAFLCPSPASPAAWPAILSFAVAAAVLPQPFVAVLPHPPAAVLRPPPPAAVLRPQPPAAVLRPHPPAAVLPRARRPCRTCRSLLSRYVQYSCSRYTRLEKQFWLVKHRIPRDWDRG